LIYILLDTETNTTLTTGNLIEHDENYLQKILNFGRELFQLSSTLDDNENSSNQKMLRVSLNVF
jgi:hypothetical protein